MWEQAEVQTAKLKAHLNHIDPDGRKQVFIVDGSGSRKDYVIVVWYDDPAGGKK